MRPNRVYISIRGARVDKRTSKRKLRVHRVLSATERSDWRYKFLHANIISPYTVEYAISVSGILPPYVAALDALAATRIKSAHYNTVIFSGLAVLPFVLYSIPEIWNLYWLEYTLQYVMQVKSNYFNSTPGGSNDTWRPVTLYCSLPS
jgi:hypothetical protein